MQFGKYQLLHKLATGGMAEVFLAKAAGPKGFEKLLVLKRILPHLASEPAFVDMFLSEARLAAQLNHPNIVQIFDFGEADGTYFLAMEYIDGPNLREIVRCSGVLGLAIPVALCARIITLACEGLAFAHNFWDLTTGRDLNIVHRDISPDNILLSRQGAVKVVDFGIAKAAGVSPHTQTGVLKGKLSYMPPEYLRNETLDGRVDVYSLGVVLYELLTGQRPFAAKSEAGMVQAILYEAPIPVAQWRPEVPQAMQRILAKALAKERESRYLDCVELQEELEEFISSTGKPVGAAQLAQLVAMMKAGAEVPGLISQASAPLRTSGRYSRLQGSLPASFAGAPPRVSGPEPVSEQAPPVPDAHPRDMIVTAVERPAKLTARYVQPSELSALQPPEPLPAPVPVPPAQPSPEPGRPVRKSPPWGVIVGGVLVLAGGVSLLRPVPVGTGARAPPPPAPVARSEAPLPPPLPPPPLLSSSGPPVAPLSQASVQEVSAVLPPPATERPVSPPPPPSLPVRRKPRAVVEKQAERASDEEVENGTLVLQVEPAGTVLQVFMEAFKVGVTPLPPRPLSPGSYTVTLKDEQKRVVATRKFVVKSGRVSLVKIDLQEP